MLKPSSVNPPLVVPWAHLVTPASWLIRDYWWLQTQSFYATSFFHVCKHPSPCESQHHDDTSALIVIQWDSLCANCQFLKAGLVDHISVLRLICLSITVIHRLHSMYMHKHNHDK